MELEDRAEKRRRYESEMDAAPCRGCLHEADPRGPITDDACKCSYCGRYPISGSNMHTCKTGWRHPVCKACNYGNYYK